MRITSAVVEFSCPKDEGRRSRGHERQRYVFRDDQTWSLTAFSLASDLGVQRDVIVNLDRFGAPTDAYVHIHLEDRAEGSGWFLFEPDRVQSSTWNHETGLTHGSMDAGAQNRTFSGHPISCDLLLMAAFDRTSPDKIQLLDNVLLSSPHHFGATGPELAPVKLEVEYLGVETRHTACGDFETDHWRILPGNDRTGHTHPGEDLWALKDTFVFVEAAIGSVGYRYELASFEDVSV